MGPIMFLQMQLTHYKSDGTVGSLKHFIVVIDAGVGQWNHGFYIFLQLQLNKSNGIAGSIIFLQL